MNAAPWERRHPYLTTAIVAILVGLMFGASRMAARWMPWIWPDLIILPDAALEHWSFSWEKHGISVMRAAIYYVGCAGVAVWLFSWISRANNCQRFGLGDVVLAILIGLAVGWCQTLPFRSASPAIDMMLQDDHVHEMGLSDEAIAEYAAMMREHHDSARRATEPPPPP